MWKRGFASLVLVASFAAAGAKKESKSAVEDVAQTIGAANLKTIQYSATGFTYIFGQSYFPNGPYPKFYAKYSRIVDYEKGLSREETLRKQLRIRRAAEGNNRFTKRLEGCP